MWRESKPLDHVKQDSNVGKTGKESQPSVFVCISMALRNSAYRLICCVIYIIIAACACVVDNYKARQLSTFELYVAPRQKIVSPRVKYCTIGKHPMQSLRTRYYRSLLKCACAGGKAAYCHVSTSRYYVGVALDFIIQRYVLYSLTRPWNQYTRHEGLSLCHCGTSGGPALLFSPRSRR